MHVRFRKCVRDPTLGSKNELVNSILGIVLVLGGEVAQVAVSGHRNVHRTCRERGRERMGTMKVVRWNETVVGLSPLRKSSNEKDKVVVLSPRP